MPGHVFRINTSASYNTFPTAAQFYGGSCSVGSPGDFTTPPQYTTSSSCVAASGFWSPTAQNRNASTAVDDKGFVNAVWIDLDLACGQCHGGTLGCGATHNGATCRDKNYLSAKAEGMHVPAGACNAPTASLHTGLTVTGKSVSFTDASTGTSGIAGISVSVNWGDGNVTNGVAGGNFSHTYALFGKYNILHTASACNVYQYDSMPVTLTAGNYTLTANTTQTSVLFVVKYNGATKAIKTGDSGTAFSLTPGTYTVTAYKSGVTFTNSPISVNLSGNTTVTFTP